MSSRVDSAPHPLPSLPPSPIEEDISRADRWAEESSSSSTLHDKSSKARGKQRESLDPPSPAYLGLGNASESDEGENGAEGYPPTKDDEAESRRVEENLRRWEQRERERRKAARESTPSSSHTSFVSDVTRQASLLWTGKRSKRPSGDGGGSHQVLRNIDDSVPLDEIDTPVTSRLPSPEPGSHQLQNLQDPFRTPVASTVSLNEPQQSAIMTASSTGDMRQPSSDKDIVAPSPKRPPILTASSSYSRPPPQPLDLPKPRSPPPKTETPHPNKPPEPIPPLTPAPVAQEEEEVPRGKQRWWTDWLCGCMESGDHQAARTNPFE